MVTGARINLSNRDIDLARFLSSVSLLVNPSSRANVTRLPRENVSQQVESPPGTCLFQMGKALSLKAACPVRLGL